MYLPPKVMEPLTVSSYSKKERERDQIFSAKLLNQS